MTKISIFNLYKYFKYSKKCMQSFIAMQKNHLKYLEYLYKKLRFLSLLFNYISIRARIFLFSIQIIFDPDFKPPLNFLC